MIPVNEPLFTEREKELLCQCIDTGWVSSDGPFVEEFEKRFAHLVGCRHGVAVANGTVALELAVRLLDLPPGAKVALPTFTIISCLLAVLRNDLQPVLVDADPATWCLDIKGLTAAFDRHPDIQAVMAVHIYGHPCNMEEIRRLASRHHARIIEDAAEAHGAVLRRHPASPPLPCGSLGEIGVFSFYANKIVTTGEGGILVTNDDHLAARARGLRNLAFQPQQRFLHQEAGYNFRLSNLQAAVGVAQLERFASLIARKKEQGKRFRQRLQHIAGLQLQEIQPWADPVYWVNGIVLDDDVPFDAPALARRLLARGIQTRPFFWPMHEQPVFKDHGLDRQGPFPVAERLARRGLYLPSGMALSNEQIDTVCKELETIMRG